MPSKAVYASQSLSIYFSRQELDALLTSGAATVPVYLHDVPFEGAWVSVSLSERSIKVLREALEQERAIYISTKLEQIHVGRKTKRKVKDMIQDVTEE